MSIINRLRKNLAATQSQPQLDEIRVDEVRSDESKGQDQVTGKLWDGYFLLLMLLGCAMALLPVTIWSLQY